MLTRDAKPADNAERTVKLRVAEALSRDVGRAVARLDPEDLAKLGAAIGDVLLIEGKQQTVCRAMPAFKEQRGQSRIQIDGLTRENAKASLDDPVTIRKASAQPAHTVTLAPTSTAVTERDLPYIGSLLDGVPVASSLPARWTANASTSLG